MDSEISLPSFLKLHSSGVTLSLYIQPGASSSMISGLHGDRLKIKIKAPPVDGEANKELIRFLGDFFSLSSKKVHLLQGETSRQKVVLLETTPPEILKLLKL